MLAACPFNAWIPRVWSMCAAHALCPRSGACRCVHTGLIPQEGFVRVKRDIVWMRPVELFSRIRRRATLLSMVTRAVGLFPALSKSSLCSTATDVLQVAYRHHHCVRELFLASDDLGANFGLRAMLRREALLPVPVTVSRSWSHGSRSII